MVIFCMYNNMKDCAQKSLCIFSVFVDSIFHGCFCCSLEYCGSRAVPSVVESQYLNHLGEHLHPSIDVLWTGK